MCREDEDDFAWRCLRLYRPELVDVVARGMGREVGGPISIESLPGWLGGLEAMGGLTPPALGAGGLAMGVAPGGATLGTTGTEGVVPGVDILEAAGFAGVALGAVALGGPEVASVTGALEVA